MKKKLCMVLAALTAAACLLSACGPEPGREEETDSLFGLEETAPGPETPDGGETETAGQEPAAGGEQEARESAAAGTGLSGQEPAGSPAEGSASGQAGTEINGQAGAADTGISGQAAAGAAGTGSLAAADAGSTGVAPETGGSLPGTGDTGKTHAPAKADGSGAEDGTGEEAELVQLDSRALLELEDYLNERSSYGFLLSCYEKPEEIDLNQVFYSGAKDEPEPLTEKEKEYLLDRIGMDHFPTGVTKVTEEYLEDILARKAGITYERSAHPLDNWRHSDRFKAYYHIHGDTNLAPVRCLDAWQRGDTLIVHYQIAPRETDPGEEENREAAAEAGDTAVQEAADTAGTGDTTAAEKADAAETENTAAAETAVAAETGGTAAESTDPSAETVSAWYLPTYEAELKKNGDDYQFRSNVLWVQKDLIEAQSYLADLDPLGEVFFAPVYPDTGTDPRADVSFALVRGKALLMTLNGMEPGNIRTDRIFTGVDAVDFTDHNGDGYTDILTVCSYRLTDGGGSGNRNSEVREARVYTMQVSEDEKEGWPVLDLEKTEAVNRDVQTLNITNITNYLTGRSDGQDKTYSSWKEAFADHLRSLNTEEYRGFALINLTEGRTPVFVQVGATTAKGATLVVYRSGKLEETWLNRNSFQYLEYENVLLSASGIENLHYDTIYSIVMGRLQVSVQGYYGNDHFARVQENEDGKASYDYVWDGGAVSENGYRDGLTFVFDASRAKECGTEGLLTTEEMLEKLQ